MNKLNSEGLTEYRVTYRCKACGCDDPCYLKFKTYNPNDEWELTCPFTEDGRREKFELLDWQEVKEKI